MGQKSSRGLHHGDEGGLGGESRYRLYHLAASDGQLLVAGGATGIVQVLLFKPSHAPL